MSNELYRDFIDRKADSIINSLGGTITPEPANAELYRDFLDRKFDDVINAISGLKTLKSFTYTGNGQLTNTITVPEDYTMIIDISGQLSGDFEVHLYSPYVKGNRYITPIRWDNISRLANTLTTTINGNSITISGNSTDIIANTNGKEFTVYYI